METGTVVDHSMKRVKEPGKDNSFTSPDMDGGWKY